MNFFCVKPLQGFDLQTFIHIDLYHTPPLDLLIPPRLSQPSQLSYVYHFASWTVLPDQLLPPSGEEGNDAGR
jgi:hypothetical protein